VSFKLETDEKMVIPKARGAIQNYGVNLVVANQLETRRDVVYLVAGALPAEAVPEIDVEKAFTQQTLYRPETDSQIEPVLVKEVCARHMVYAENRLESDKSEATALICGNIRRTLSPTWSI